MATEHQIKRIIAESYDYKRKTEEEKEKEEREEQEKDRRYNEWLAKKCNEIREQK